MIGGRKKHSPLRSSGNRAIPLAVIANASTKMKEYLLSGKLLFTFVL